MAGMNKIESYLIDFGVAYEEIGENFFFVNDETRGFPGIQICYADPIVIIRANVMPLPTNNQSDFFKKLLELNVNELAHGAYGIDGDTVVLIDTLEYDTMDKTEFEASLDSIGMALAKHYDALSKYRS